MSKLEYTSSTAIESKYETVRAAFHRGITDSLDFRRDQLRNLYYGILDHEQELKEALHADLHRAHEETEALELNEILTEIALAIAKLDEWTADAPLPTVTGDSRYALGKSVLRKTPYGVTLIIGPWNYPYLCTIVPVISALAAGNTVVVKPTEVAVESTRTLTRVLQKVLDPHVLQVVNGAVEETTQLLAYQWDKIMITGSNRVGKIVAHAAAENLTPVCLELGGKSPAVITASANLKLAAKRLAWAKFVNAGQTCIAPDYVIADRKIAAEFVRHLKAAISAMYPDLSRGGAGRDFAHIVTDRLFERAVHLVESSTATDKWQLEQADAATRLFPPTVLSGGLTEGDIVMQEELFCPILPVIEVDNAVVEAPTIIKGNHDYPLAMYIFSTKSGEQEELLTKTRSGAVMVNDAVMQGGSAIIPFGGVGASGTGRYHGKYGFDEFTFERPVIVQPNWAEALLNARYAPYNSTHSALLRAFSRPLRVGFGRTGKVKSQSFVLRLFHQLVKKLGLTVVVVALIYYFRLN